MNILEYLSVNLRIVQRIQKELDESNGDYEAMAAQKPFFDRSDKKNAFIHLPTGPQTE